MLKKVFKHLKKEKIEKILLFYKNLQILPKKAEKVLCTFPEKRKIKIYKFKRMPPTLPQNERKFDNFSKYKIRKKFTFFFKRNKKLNSSDLNEIQN